MCGAEHGGGGGGERRKLHNNRLKGPLPSELGEMVALQILCVPHRLTLQCGVSCPPDGGSTSG
jgi:hypothetical protein